jgi:YHS domain-containing protein
LQTDGNDFSFLLADIHCNFMLETNLQRKSGRNGKTFLFFFCEATILQRFRNGSETVHLQRNGTETDHLQRNGSLQRIETGCETFRENYFENYFATVSSVRNYIPVFISGKF